MPALPHPAPHPFPLLVLTPPPLPLPPLTLLFTLPLPPLTPLLMPPPPRLPTAAPGAPTYDTAIQLDIPPPQHIKQRCRSKVQGCDHPLHLGVDILQSLNEMEELRDFCHMLHAQGEYVQCNEGKGA